MNKGDIAEIKDWLKTAIIATVGGGIAGAFAAAMNPADYVFPKDFGSGKLWKFFFQGAAVTFGALVLKSQWGQKVSAEFRSTQASLQQSQQTVQEARTDLKQSVKPPEGKP